MTAFYLVAAGIAAAVAPCPLMANITAVSYICSNPGSRKRTVAAGLSYSIGRAAAYVILGVLLSLGLTGAPQLSLWLQESLPVYMGPLLIISGLVVSECIPFPTIGKKPDNKTVRRLSERGLTGSFLLGALFAMALCPPGAALFFGTALPLATVLGEWAWLGLSLFGLGTALPVVLVTLLISFSASKTARVLKHLPAIQKRSKLVAGGILFLFGTYLTLNELIL